MNMLQNRSVTWFLAVLAAVLVICIMIYPDHAFQSSLSGLTIWWTFVFPALLPFLILSEILIGTGLVRAFGTLLEPLMRLLFRLPGYGGWSIAMGLFAGYPAGARTTSQLQHQSFSISLGEAQRLLALSHLSHPVLMLTVIGVGFLNSAATGVFLAIVHYSSAVLMDLIMRVINSSAKSSLDKMPPHQNESSRYALYAQAWINMKLYQAEDGRTFGKLLGDAVGNAIQALLLLGGIIMFFSVLHRMISILLPYFYTDSWIGWIIPAVLEPHLGAYIVSQTPMLTLDMKIALICALLAWSGLSVLVQVKSLLFYSQLRFAPFLLTRLLHSGLAFVMAVLLWRPFNNWIPTTQPSLKYTEPLQPSMQAWVEWSVWSSSTRLLFLCFLFLITLTVLSTLIGFIHRWHKQQTP